MADMKNITCEQFLSLLNDEADGILSDENRRAMEAHASACASCARQKKMNDLLIDGLAGLDDSVTVPLNAQSAWRRAVKWEANARKRRRFTRIAAGIAAVFVVMVASTFALRSGGRLDALSVNNESALDSSGERLRIASSGGVHPLLMARSGNMLVEADGADGIEGAVEAAKEVPASNEGFVFEDVAEESFSAFFDAASGTEYGEEAEILRVNRYLRAAETNAFDQERTNLISLVGEYEGYFASDKLESAENSDARYSVSEICVPDAIAQEFMEALENIGETLKYEAASEDVSAYYFDAEARLNSQKMIVDRLNELIFTATGEEIKTIQSELNASYDAIDELEKVLSAYDRQVSYATVTFTLYEKTDKTAWAELYRAVKPIPSPEPSLSERSASGFRQSLSAVGGFFEDMVVSMAVIAPVAGVILAAAALIWGIAFIIKKNKRHDKSDE